MYGIDKRKTREASEQRTKAIDYRRQANKVLLERDHSSVKTSVVAQPGMTCEDMMTMLAEEESSWPNRR